MGGELLLSPVGLNFYLGGMRSRSIDGEAVGATAKPSHSVYLCAKPAALHKPLD